MPKTKLTVQSIKRKPPEIGTLEIWDTICPGLALRIHAGGKRSYCVTTRLAGTGKQIRRTVGSTLTLTIAEARDAARQVIADAAKGKDSHSKQAKHAAARSAQVEAERSNANSFRSVVEAYLTDPGEDGGAGRKSTNKIELRLEKYAMPRFGDRPIGEITKAEIKDLLREITTAGKPVAANRFHGSLKRVFNWAAEADKIEISPMAGMKKPAKEVSRDRVLADAELAEIWTACGSLPKALSGVVRLMLLTGARRSEAGGLRRSELHDDEWHLPAERSKNGLPHIWPLANLTRDVIANVPQIDGGDPVFTFNGKTCVSGWTKVKARIDGTIGKARAEAAGETFDPEKHELAHWTFHDLRRTVSTMMHGKLAVPPIVVEATINHVSGLKASVAGIYNRSSYLPQRREALEKWADYVIALAGGKSTKGIVYEEPAANVVSIRRAS